MYSYEWDSSTGGYVLTPTPLTFSKEPRPVYYKELDILDSTSIGNMTKMTAFPICGRKQITTFTAADWLRR